MRIGTIKRISILALCLWGFVASSDHSSNIERAVRRYEVAAWPTNSVVPGIVESWAPILPEVVVDGRPVSTNRTSAVLFDSIQFVCPSNGSVFSDGFDLRVSRWNDFNAAKEDLLARLGGMESPVLLLPGTNGLETVGDICFAKESECLPSVVLFVRNNVLVFCYATIGHDTFTNLLQSIDGQILDNLHSEEE